jgi:hypothetical protein
MDDNLRIRVAKSCLDIMENPRILIKNIGTAKKVEPNDLLKAKEMNFHASFIEAYPYCAEMPIDWILQEYEDEIPEEERLGLPYNDSIAGSMKIWPLSSIFLELGNLTYYDENEDDPEMKNFHIVDYYADENMVGTLAGNYCYESLCNFEAGTNYIEPLHLNLEGYIIMAMEARAFYPWPTIILSYLSGESSPEMEKMKLYMPKIFRGWTWEGFIQKYEEVRLR